MSNNEKQIALERHIDSTMQCCREPVVYRSPIFKQSALFLTLGVRIGCCTVYVFVDWWKVFRFSFASSVMTLQVTYICRGTDFTRDSPSTWFSSYCATFIFCTLWCIEDNNVFLFTTSSFVIVYPDDHKCLAVTIMPYYACPVSSWLRGFHFLATRTPFQLNNPRFENARCVVDRQLDNRSEVTRILAVGQRMSLSCCLNSNC